MGGLTVPEEIRASGTALWWRKRKAAARIPFGSAINRRLTFKMAQTPVQHDLPKLLTLIEEGKIAPWVVIGDRIKVVMKP